MLIDSDKLRQAILSIMPERSEVLLIVDNQPDAVVRCKDCGFGKCCQNGKHERSVECHNPEKLVVELHTPEWFCADGWKEGDVEKIEAFLREKEPFMFEWHDGGDDIY